MKRVTIRTKYGLMVSAKLKDVFKLAKGDRIVDAVISDNKPKEESHVRINRMGQKDVQEEDVIVKDYMTKHKIGDKTYDVPDMSAMTGKIIINENGDPEIVYVEKRKVEDTR